MISFDKKPNTEKACKDIKNITLIGLFVNLVLSVLKFVLGVLGNSSAVVADSIHSISDMSTDIAVFFGVEYWSRPPDESHPYGHGRLETLVTLFIGVIIALAAGGIVFSVMVELRTCHVHHPRIIALWAALASIISKEILYRMTLAVGRDSRSSAVVANAWHHRSDAISSIPAALAVMIAMISPSWAFVDSIGALVVSLFVFQASWKILSPVMRELMEGSVSKILIERVKKIVLSIEGIESTHAIRARRIGSGIYVDLHIQVDGDMTVTEGHQISRDVKEEVKKQCPDVVDVIVHLEPYMV